MPDIADVVSLARSLAKPELDMVILAEGNVSARADAETFWIKGSGKCMQDIAPEDISRVRLGSVWAALHRAFDDDRAIRQALNETLVEGPSPSTETFMHAALLALPDVQYIAHVHPSPLLSILCLEKARDYAARRLFPDEIVLCGPASCFVPYVAPGLELARSIQRLDEGFVQDYGMHPKCFWLQNHGLICVGNSAREVESACLMSVKAARVLLAALQSGGQIHWLSDDEVGHIYRWPDERARQKALWTSA